MMRLFWLRTGKVIPTSLASMSNLKTRTSEPDINTMTIEHTKAIFGSSNIFDIQYTSGIQLHLKNEQRIYYK